MTARWVRPASRFLLRLTAVSVFIGAATPSAPAAAQERTAKAILADYAKAVGGLDAWARRKSLHVRREVTVKSMGVTASEERWATAAGKLLTVLTIPGIGTVRMGSTGAQRWSEDPINGLRVLKGAEDEQVRIEATWAADLKLDKLFKRVRVVPPPAQAEGAKWECLELSPRLGKPAVACFDAETHLRVFQTGTQATPQGEIPYTTRLSEWKDVDGLKLPFREEMTAGPVSTDARLLEAKFDEPVDPQRFRLPRPSATKAGPVPAAPPSAAPAAAPEKPPEAGPRP